MPMEILETCNVYNIYYIDAQNRTAAVSVGTDEEDTAMLVMQALKVAEESGLVDTVKNAVIVEVAEEYFKYKLNNIIEWKLSNQRYSIWNYKEDAYEGKSGFQINEMPAENVLQILTAKKVVNILIWLDNKLTKLVKKGTLFKKCFSLKAMLVRVYFLISQDYYNKI